MKHVLSAKGLKWTNIQSPEPEELAEFVREIGLVASDAEFVAQNHHRPEITVQPDYIMWLIQVPVFDRKLRVTQGVSLFLIAKEQNLYSLHYEPLVALDKLRGEFESSPERQEEYFGEEALSLGLYIMMVLYDGAFRKLERLSKHIDIAEDAVFQGNERKMVEEIAVLARDVMDFRKIVRPHTRLFSVVPQHALMNPELVTRWNRNHGQLLKMWEMLEGMSESMKELSNTNFTLLQYKENELLRLLTMYSIIVIPMLVLVDPLFNPSAENATLIDSIVFWAVIGVLVLTLLFILIRTKSRRLL